MRIRTHMYIAAYIYVCTLHLNRISHICAYIFVERPGSLLNRSGNAFIPRLIERHALAPRPELPIADLSLPRRRAAVFITLYVGKNGREAVPWRSGVRLEICRRRGVVRRA